MLGKEKHFNWSGLISKKTVHSSWLRSLFKFFPSKLNHCFQKGSWEETRQKTSHVKITFAFEEMISGPKTRHIWPKYFLKCCCSLRSVQAKWSKSNALTLTRQLYKILRLTSSLLNCKDLFLLCLCQKLLVEVLFVPQGENYRGVATAVLCHFILRFPDWYLGKLECFVASGDSMSCKALIYDGTTF